MRKIVCVRRQNIQERTRSGEDRIVTKVFNENVVTLEEGGRIHFAYIAMSGEIGI
tara:strand:+ start:330 stop:494 length:165 start_codon:yes stop_codon:yes gene_type:complete